MRPLALFCTLLLPIVHSRLLAQQFISQLSAADLTHAFVQHAKSASGNQQDYTFLILHRDLNYIHGIRTSDQTYLYEQVFIGGMPYVHLLEHNGKPLKGKLLAHENELYAKTLKDRTGLTPDVRNKLAHANYHTIQAYALDQLESQFRPAITGHPTVDGHPTILLDLTPLHPDAPPALQRHILLTLDASNLNVLQSHVETLASDNNFSKGSVFELHNAYINGVLLPAFISADTIVPVKHMLITANIHVIGTDEFSNYRRFTTSVTLKSTLDDDVPAPPRN